MPAAGEWARTARRLYLLPLAGWVVMAVAGYLPTQSLSGWRGVEAMIVAQAVVVAIVYATLVPAVRRMAKADAQDRFQHALKAGVIRLMLTLLASVAVAFGSPVEPGAFLIWVGTAYVVMINVETLILVYWMKHLERQR